MGLKITETVYEIVMLLSQFKVIALIVLAMQYQHRQVRACSWSASAFRNSEGGVVLCYDMTRNNVLTYAVVHCGSERIKLQ
jgi:hypothetical protein